MDLGPVKDAIALPRRARTVMMHARKKVMAHVQRFLEAALDHLRAFGFHLWGSAGFQGFIGSELRWRWLLWLCRSI